MNMVSNSPLPLEIIVIIAEHVDERRSDTFKAIAEVCTAWVPIGQKHLFRSILNSPSQVRNLVDMLHGEDRAEKQDVERLLRYTHKVRIWERGTVPWDAQIPLVTIPLLLSKLPNLRSLHLDYFPFQCDPVRGSTLLGTHGHGQQFELDWIKINYHLRRANLFDFVIFLNLFRRIGHLDLSADDGSGFVELRPGDALINIQRRFQREFGPRDLSPELHLATLSLSNSTPLFTQTIFRLFRSYFSVKSLKRIAMDVGGSSAYGISALCSLLHTSKGADVEELHLGFVSDPRQRIRSDSDTEWFGVWGQTSALSHRHPFYRVGLGHRVVWGVGANIGEAIISQIRQNPPPELALPFTRSCRGARALITLGTGCLCPFRRPTLRRARSLGALGAHACLQGRVPRMRRNEQLSSRRCSQWKGDGADSCHSTGIHEISRFNSVSPSLESRGFTSRSGGYRAGVSRKCT
ncbi:hypothetical protein BXZ70DRAFT_5702 [Cristinia sonorae]|uniref:Uncharacterized protein n=1 Tax=Cristinia sonorae TaxID=1940300 RepID=A0A8K0XVF1_9AGAR|nr:hypothetical protein BXZ70DRAFT_5702 [Cristinia sonorae]